MTLLRTTVSAALFRKMSSENAHRIYATAAGVAAGAIGGALLARLLTSQFYGVSARNPWIYLAVLALITLAASFTSLAPVFSAARVDPAESLRQE